LEFLALYRATEEGFGWNANRHKCPELPLLGSVRLDSFQLSTARFGFRLTKIAARCGHRAENEYDKTLYNGPIPKLFKDGKTGFRRVKKPKINKYIKFIAVLAQCLSNELESGWSGASRGMRVDSEWRGPCPEPMTLSLGPYCTLDHHRLQNFCGQIHE
jgi:hypothetical protein